MVDIQTPPLIRLHILANSNTPEDQDLKQGVRDQIITAMREEFRDSRSLDESRAILKERLKYLEKVAGEYIGEKGHTYPVKAVYGNFAFPRKDYGAFALPAGKYEAVRMIIGEGKGANWWCILFPPLCVVDGGQNIRLEKDLTQQIKADELRCKVVRIKPALKITEIWRNAFKD